jgi:hypothetical protein
MPKHEITEETSEEQLTNSENMNVFLLVSPIDKGIAKAYLERSRTKARFVLGEKETPISWFSFNQISSKLDIEDALKQVVINV